MRSLICLLFFFPAGCTLTGPPPAGLARERTVSVLDEGAASSPVEFTSGLEEGEPGAATAPAAVHRGERRQVIYDGTFTLEVRDRELILKQVRKLVAELEGFIQEEGSNRVELRVPATRFDPAVERIAAMGRVVSRSIKAKDVTEDYQDLQLRIGMKEKFLAELQELYGKGGSLKDLLEVKREIDRVREELERLKGRLRWLADRVAFSRITVTFREVKADFTRPFDLPFRWLDLLGVRELLSL